MTEQEEFEFRARMEREAEAVAKPKAAAKEGPSMLRSIGQGVGNLAAGALRGAGSIGATLLTPVDAAARALNGGQPVSVGGVELLGHNRRKGMDGGLAEIGAETDSFGFGAGKLAGEIAGTMGAGGVLAQGVARVAPAAVNLTSALATSGMRAGAATGARGIATRIAGGALAGGAGAGLIDPGTAHIGAAVGGALPPALAGVGAAGRFIGNKLATPALTPEVQRAVQAARDAGYVMPPTQVKPTLTNRLLEGFSGKLTTAQNASARNQPVTNELARKAIGAADLSEAGIAQVRAKANQAYDDIGGLPDFQADDGFVGALNAAGRSTTTMRRNFPQLVNSEVDNLVDSLKSRAQFDSQSTIEALKQFRANATANKASTEPAKKALGRAEAKIAAALEDMVERNLQRSGNAPMLQAFRDARQTLAKTYDVEKALNRTTGNVDGNKLAQQMQKGKPMTGDLRVIADFAARFPKANQTVERMGSLPGWSPLDFAALGTMSAATANPAVMAGVVARPIARAITLGPRVQNGLTRPSTNRLLQALEGAETNQLLYRATPAATSR